MERGLAGAERLQVCSARAYAHAHRSFIRWRARTYARTPRSRCVSPSRRRCARRSYPCNGAADCGRQISEAISNQTKWITEAQGPDALMVTYLWQEAFQYLEDGYLIIPDNVMTIFTDAGSGYVTFDPAL